MRMAPKAREFLNKDNFPSSKFNLVTKVTPSRTWKYVLSYQKDDWAFVWFCCPSYIVHKLQQKDMWNLLMTLDPSFQDIVLL